ncbi:hypothetical protein QNN00_13930 [Bacillus velezensis]|nr:hypothetical protein [Bacillus velezensis]
MNLQSDVSLFLKDSLTHRTIPIAETFTVDTITPIQMVEKLDRNITYLLESKDESSSWSRYSLSASILLSRLKRVITHSLPLIQTGIRCLKPEN